MRNSVERIRPVECFIVVTSMSMTEPMNRWNHARPPAASDAPQGEVPS